MLTQNKTGIIASLTGLMLLIGVGAFILFYESGPMPEVQLQPPAAAQPEADEPPDQATRRRPRGPSVPAGADVPRQKTQKPFRDLSDEEIREKRGRTDLPGSVAR